MGSIVRLYHPESSTTVTVGPLEGGQHQVLMQGFDGDESLEIASSKGLWVIEKETVTEGDRCPYVENTGASCAYRFQHMGTGRYLAAIMTEKNPEGNFHVDDFTREKDSLFTCELSGISASIMPKEHDNVVLRHSSSSRYVYAGETCPDESDGYPGAIASIPSLGKSPLDEHTLVIQAAETSEVNDFRYLLGCMPGCMPMLEAFRLRMRNIAAKNSELNLPKAEEPAPVQDAVSAVKAQMAFAKSSGRGKPSAFDIGTSDLQICLSQLLRRNWLRALCPT